MLNERWANNPSMKATMKQVAAYFGWKPPEPVASAKGKTKGKPKRGDFGSLGIPADMGLKVSKVHG